MPLIIILVIAISLKLFEVSFMENVSWWWINGFALLIFLWFDFFERLFGLDKKKDELHHEKMKKERLNREFKLKKKK